MNERKTNQMKNELTIISNQALITESELSLQLQRLSDEFINYIDVKPSTINTYRKALKHYIQYIIDNEITEQTRETIINYKKYLIETNHKATTIQSYLNALKQLFNYLNFTFDFKNITEHIKSPKISKGFKKDYLTQAQAKELLQSINTTTTTGKRDYAILSIMLTCGLRTVELERANIEDITLMNGETVLFVLGKGRDEKSEFVVISREVEKAIKSYLATRENQSPEQPLFISEDNKTKGHRLTKESISRIVKTKLRSIGLDSERLTAHSLRHTTATLNILNGGSIAETQQLLRHSNINTTMLYNHALERKNNQSEKRLTQLLFN